MKYSSSNQIYLFSIFKLIYKIPMTDSSWKGLMVLSTDVNFKFLKKKKKKKKKINLNFCFLLLTNP